MLQLILEHAQDQKRPAISLFYMLATSMALAAVLAAGLYYLVAIAPTVLLLKGSLAILAAAAVATILLALHAVEVIKVPFVARPTPNADVPLLTNERSQH